MNSSPQANAAMRAAVWHGRHDIRVEDVPLPAEPPPGWKENASRPEIYFKSASVL